MRIPHAPQLIARVAPTEHSTSALGLHIPPHEVKPGAHSHRPMTHASPPAQGPDSQMFPQPSGSPQRRPVQSGTHASIGGCASTPASNGSVTSIPGVASKGRGPIGVPRIVVGTTSDVTHTPLSPQV
jgi:hypothetical protein